MNEEAKKYEDVVAMLLLLLWCCCAIIRTRKSSLIYRHTFKTIWRGTLCTPTNGALIKSSDCSDEFLNLTSTVWSHGYVKKHFSSKQFSNNTFWISLLYLLADWCFSICWITISNRLYITEDKNNYYCML